MKVAMIETGGWGGIAHYTWNLCGALSEAEAEVILVTNHQYELDGLPRQFRLDQCFRRQSGYFQTVRMLMRHLSSIRPDIVHVQSLVSTRFDAFLWPLIKRRTPVVFTAHNIRSHERDIWGDWTLWRCLHSANAVITHTEEAVTAIRRHLGADARVDLVQHGDYAFFRNPAAQNPQACRRLLGLPLDPPLLLIFGAIRPYKGIHGVIAALPRIRQRHPDAHLVIVGPLLVGTKKEYTEAIAQAGVSRAVIFRPDYVPYDHVAAYFAAADLALYNYHEVTDSGALRIACSQRTPVVATEVGGFREFLENGVTGRLVPCNDVDSFVDAVCQLLANPAEGKRMAKAAAELADSKWSWTDCAKATRAIYSTVLRQTVTSPRLTASSGPKNKQRADPFL